MGWTKQQVEAVKALGERIGYGSMMDLASALWAITLEDEYGIKSGAFIPTVAGFMHPEEAERATKEREEKMDIIREILNS